MRLRQICLVAGALEPAASDLCDVLGLDVGFRDPAVGRYGLENIVSPIGGDFLEIVAPVEEGTSAGRHLARRGDGGYMVIMHGPDAVAARDRFQALGVRAPHVIEKEDYVATHFHPADTGGVMLSVDSTPGQPDVSERLCHWSPGGPAWRDHLRDDISTNLVAVELASADAAAQAAQWAEGMELAVEQHGDLWRLPVTDGEIRILPKSADEHPGIRALDIRMKDVDTALARATARNLPHGRSHSETGGPYVEICGVRFNLIR